MTPHRFVPSDGGVQFPSRPEQARPYAAELMRRVPDVRPQSASQVASPMHDPAPQPTRLHAVDDEPATVAAASCDGSMTCDCTVCVAERRLRVRRGVRNPPAGLPRRRAA